MEDNTNDFLKELAFKTTGAKFKLPNLKVNKTTDLIRKAHHALNSKFNGNKAKAIQTTIKKYNEHAETVSETLSPHMETVAKDMMYIMMKETEELYGEEEEQK